MDILQLVESTLPISSIAAYSCVLTNTWSGARHPIDYPSGSAHWSPPVLLAHNRFVDLWTPGDFASPSIENIAELGNTDALQAEIEIYQTQGLAGDFVRGVHQFNAVDPPQVFDPIVLSPSYPYLSTISMIAPSPDWFSGLDSFSPRGPEGYWYKTFDIATYPFDAGTEEGDTYSLDNEESVPHGPIYPLTRDTVPENGVFLDPTGTTVLPVASWRCDLVVDEGVSPEVVQDSSPQMNQSGGLRGDAVNDNMSQMNKASNMWEDEP
eukprot:CAMPEP_0116106304 /NCGR_PEP_ID=MMETSP0327-20121206/15563_1 /TAXON_ID=44447 /ORGANISM="Pseudo-nitzschia delicatissima, Strain B596" /LENGTH=265 /DNA_ID=CAMNT_0003598905 /DNA_START=32 /DNA_END=829 /DNA_ORIENTATION=+